MTEKLTRSDQAADLRKRAEEIALEKTAQSPENLKAMSPGNCGDTLSQGVPTIIHELQVHQIELERHHP